MERPMNRPIAVIGAGTLGRRIALTFAGRPGLVRLIDRDPDTLARARDHVQQGAAAQVDRLGSAGPAHVHTSTDLADAVSDAWLVIEAIDERLDLKREVFRQLAKHAPPDAILATNSSSFPSRLLIDDAAVAERTLNTHFYMPPDQPVVEIMSSGRTSASVIDSVTRAFSDFGLRPFVVRAESMGFIYNRIWAAIKRESLSVVAEGVATPQEVDELFTLCASPVGPFRTMDFVGLDTALDIESHYTRSNPRISPDAQGLLQKYVDRGLLGLKTREGFYSDYF